MVVTTRLRRFVAPRYIIINARTLSTPERILRACDVLQSSPFTGRPDKSKIKWKPPEGLSGGGGNAIDAKRVRQARHLYGRGSRTETEGQRPQAQPSRGCRDRFRCRIRWRTRR